MQDSNLDEIEKAQKEKPKKKTKTLPDKPIDLVFVRIFDPVHIPTYLVDQIKDKKFETKRFYEFQKISCTIQVNENVQLNPTNLLYVLINEEKKQAKGFLWMVVDLLTFSLVVNNFSVDQQYWHKGGALKLLEEKAKKVMKDLFLKRIVWMTRNGLFCEALGFKKHEEQVMVYEGEV